VEALYLDRDQGSRDQVVVIDELNENQPLFGTGDVSFDFEPGSRATWGIGCDPCSPCSAWEFSYMGICDWSGSASVSGEGNLGVVGDLGLVTNAFSGADRISLDYSSELYSFEANCVKCYQRCCDRLEFLCGFRYLALYEDFAINASDFSEGDGAYKIRTRNDLFGLQTGVRFRRSRRLIQWEVLGKVGIYGNSAEQSQVVTDFPPGFVVRSHRGNHDGDAAFVGELGANVICPVNGIWAVRAGYSLLWLAGVALAPDQLDFTNVPSSGTRIDHTGNALFHGVSLGLEARF
jgi:hypothetical protein